MKTIDKILIILFLLSGITVYSQDPHFTQFYANPLYLNPAFAGSAMCPRMVLNYRNQWPAIPGTYVTYNASYDQYINKISGGVGILANYDEAGLKTINTSMVSGIYSFSTPLNRYVSLKAGFEVSVFQVKLDWSKLTFGDEIDPKYGFIYNTQNPIPPTLKRTVPDFSSGILIYSDDFYGGVAVDHLATPDIGFESLCPLPRRLTVHVGGVIDMEHHRRKRIDDPMISPNIVYMRQQDFEQINFGMYYNKFPMVGGLWFRKDSKHNDALIALIGIYSGSVKIGYSYDFTVSKLTNVSGGAHEISCIYMFDCAPKKIRVRPIMCPVF